MSSSRACMHVMNVHKLYIYITREVVSLPYYVKQDYSYVAVNSHLFLACIIKTCWFYNMLQVTWLDYWYLFSKCRRFSIYVTVHKYKCTRYKWPGEWGNVNFLLKGLPSCIKRQSRDNSYNSIVYFSVLLTRVYSIVI